MNRYNLLFFFVIIYKVLQLPELLIYGILEKNTSCFQIVSERGALVPLNMTPSDILTSLITKYLFLSNLNPDCCHLGPHPFVQ